MAFVFVADNKYRQLIIKIFIRHICDGMRFLEEKGIVHRDLGEKITPLLIDSLLLNNYPFFF
jgi:hypothetical protein